MRKEPFLTFIIYRYPLGKLTICYALLLYIKSNDNPTFRLVRFLQNYYYGLTSKETRKQVFCYNYSRNRCHRKKLLRKQAHNSSCIRHLKNYFIYLKSQLCILDFTISKYKFRFFRDLTPFLKKTSGKCKEWIVFRLFIFWPFTFSKKLLVVSLNWQQR